jgi:hypothetical protein
MPEHVIRHAWYITLVRIPSVVGVAAPTSVMQAVAHSVTPVQPVLTTQAITVAQSAMA